jgi:MFS family permease
MLLSALVPREIRGTGIGVYRTFFDLGAFTGPVILTAVLSAVGFPLINICFYLGTAMALSTLIMIFTSRKMMVKDYQVK